MKWVSKISACDGGLGSRLRYWIVLVTHSMGDEIWCGVGRVIRRARWIEMKEVRSTAKFQKDSTCTEYVCDDV